MMSETFDRPLKEQWSELLQTAEQYRVDAELSMREAAQIVAQSGQMGSALERALPVWPHQVLNHSPMLWKLGWQAEWVARARALRDQYRNWTRGTINGAIGELQWQTRSAERHLLQRHNLNARELDRRFDGIGKLVTPLAQQATEIANLVAEARRVAKWLLDLPLARIQQPRHWIARYLPVMRQDTNYRAHEWQSATVARAIYRRAFTSIERVQFWIPKQFSVCVALENVKIDFYRELLRPNMNRMRALVEYAHDVAEVSEPLSWEWSLDLGEIYFQYSLLAHKQEWAEAARGTLSAVVQANCPTDLQALAADRLASLYRVLR